MTTAPTGRCRACGRTITLRADGLIRGHKDTRPGATKGWCYGSQRQPSEGTLTNYLEVDDETILG